MSLPRPSRRALLGGLLAGGLAAGMPGRARAAVAPSERRFIFVYTPGGWDVTRVFAPLFGADVGMEADAGEAQAGGIPFVDHQNRPSVRAFMENYHDRLCILNGVYVPSISHSAATRLTLTGTVDGSQADWPTRIAARRGTAQVLPCLIAGGPSFAGPHGVHVAHSGGAGQLQALGDGSMLGTSDMPVSGISPQHAEVVDDFLRDAALRRAVGATGKRKAILDDLQLAIGRSGQLKHRLLTDPLMGGSSFPDQMELAINALGDGLARCVSIAHPGANEATAWDTHALNDLEQNSLFEDLFSSLTQLIFALERNPGVNAPSLAEETVVVVLSEMGRTPSSNGSGGKDHWPYTSAMLFGPGVRGDQVVGAFDQTLVGLDVDLESGAPDEGGQALGNNVVGATLLALADIDPRDEGIVDSPIGAVLA